MFHNVSTVHIQLNRAQSDWWEGKEKVKRLVRRRAEWDFHFFRKYLSNISDSCKLTNFTECVKLTRVMLSKQSYINPLQIKKTFYNLNGNVVNLENRILIIRRNRFQCT